MPQNTTTLNGPAYSANAIHDAILNVLDDWSTSETADGPMRIFFTASAFEPTVSDWSGIPIIYGREHPNPEAYDANAGLELKRINGEVVGKVSKASINNAGNPKLMGQLKIKDDDLETLISNGQVSISTGFLCTVDEAGHVTGNVKPHHLLLFNRDGISTPGDKGATILNATKDDINEDEFEGLFSRIKAKLGFKPKPPVTTNAANGVINMPENTEPKVEAPKVNKELEDAKKLLADKTAELESIANAVKAKDDELAKAKADLDAAQKAIAEKDAAITKAAAESKDREWAAFKNTLPKGMVHGDAEAKSRKEWEENPTAFAQRVIACATTIQAPAPEGDAAAGTAKPSGINTRVWDEKAQAYVWAQV